MNLKKTDSKIIENHSQDIFNANQYEMRSQNIKHVDFVLDQPADKKNQDKQKQSKQNNLETRTQMEKRLKMPNSLKASLKKRAQQKSGFRQRRNLTHKSRFGSMIASKIKKQEISCGICLGIIKDKNTVNLCKCQHTFCMECIRDYVTYKIKMFQQVTCANQQCDLVMDKQTQFYKGLSDDLKRQYVKIHEFYVTSKDSSLRLCPKQNCEGKIKIIEGQPRLCDKCKLQFCPKCYFQMHAGDCDANQIDFIQNNFKFRQCTQCGIIVERTQGCNHMTCRCKYQFCYMCGLKWNGYDHLCPGQVAAPGANGGGQDCDCSLQCACCMEPCGQTITSVFSCLLKALVSVVLGIFLLIILLNTMLMLAFYVLLTFLLSFGYAFQLICQLCDNDNQLAAVILLIIFPIPWVYGLVLSFKQIFFQMASEQCNELCDMRRQGCQNIWE